MRMDATNQANRRTNLEHTGMWRRGIPSRTIRGLVITIIALIWTLFTLRRLQYAIRTRDAPQCPQSLSLRFSPRRTINRLDLQENTWVNHPYCHTGAAISKHMSEWPTTGDNLFGESMSLGYGNSFAASSPPFPLTSS